MRVESHVTSLSWIPSEAVTGYLRTAFKLGVSSYDDPPPDMIDPEKLGDTSRFRFANRLRAWAEFDGERLVDHGVEGGVLMGSTSVHVGRLGATFAAVALPDLRGEPVVGDGFVRVTQTVGGRTAFPLPRKITAPPFVRLQSPLVWTTLALTLHADGRAEAELVGASPFPRHWVYDDADSLSHKAGLTDWEQWLGQPTWRRTPWGDEDSPVLVTAAETALERQLSTLIMSGGERPKVRTLEPGGVLVQQGEPGASLFLLLDGVLTVAVDGRPICELGPGAVLGERAVVEGGLRTATLTAATPVRIAEAPADAIDRAALEELASGHRREAPA